VTPIVIDDFLEDPHGERALALKAEYQTVVHHDITYRGIAMTHAPASQARILEAVGMKDTPGIFTTFWRRYLAEEENETYIHADAAIGEVTGVLFLSPPERCQGGLAFWRHRLYGWSHVPPQSELERLGLEDTPEFWQSLVADGHFEKRWEMVDYVPMAFNRLVLFWSPMFHSRYPKRAFGSRLEDARLVKCFFFSPQRSVPRGTDSTAQD
jgi:hypothetical protein